MGSQLGLFCDVSRVRHYFDDDAPAIYREPSACGGCHTVRKIVARAWRDGALVDLCVQCTAVEIEHRRARGQHVPEGFGWVR